MSSFLIFERNGNLRSTGNKKQRNKYRWPIGQSTAIQRTIHLPLFLQMIKLCPALVDISLDGVNLPSQVTVCLRLAAQQFCITNTRRFKIYWVNTRTSLCTLLSHINLNLDKVASINPTCNYKSKRSKGLWPHSLYHPILSPLFSTRILLISLPLSCLNSSNATVRPGGVL